MFLIAVGFFVRFMMPPIKKGSTAITLTTKPMVSVVIFIFVLSGIAVIEEPAKIVCS
jgi:hypothetical protein